MSYLAIPTGPNDVITMLTGAATSISMTGLNGDLVGDYQIDFYLSIVQNNCSVEFQPNAVATNKVGMKQDWRNGFATSADWKFGQNATNPFLYQSGESAYGYLYLRARSGRTRFIDAWSFDDLAADNCHNLRGIWTDTTTNVTSFSIVAGVASGLGTGSWMRVRSLMTRT